MPLPVVQMLQSNNWLQHGAAVPHSSSHTPHSAPRAVAAQLSSRPSLLRRNDEDAFFPALAFPDASGLLRHLAAMCGAGAAAAVAHDDSAGSDDPDGGQQKSSGAQYSEGHGSFVSCPRRIF